MNEEHVLDINTEGWTPEEITRAYERRREQELERQQQAEEAQRKLEEKAEGERTYGSVVEMVQSEDDDEGRHYYETAPTALTAEQEQFQDVSFFGRLLLSQKFLMLGIIAFIMVSIPFGLYLYQAKQNIQTTLLEAQGIDPALGIVKLSQLTQQHRSMSAKVLNGDTALAASRFNLAKEIGEAFSGMDSTMNANITNLSVVKDWNTTKTHWQALSDKVKNNELTSAESLAAHTTLLEEYYALLDRIADTTALVLDPEANTYFMMRASLYSMPQLAESLDRTIEGSTGLLTSKQADPVQLALVTSYVSLAKAGRKEGFNLLQKSLDIDPVAKDALQSIATRTMNKLDKNLGITEDEVIKKPSLSYDAKTFSDDMKTVMVDLYLLNKSQLEQLRIQLDARKNRLLYQLFTVGGGILVLAIISLLISYYVSRSITGPVDQLVGVMRQLAAGDSSVRANYDSLDEIGILARQFDSMVDQREAASAKVQQENETLNNSIINMLEAVAGLAQRDLTVKAPVAEDITGPMGDALNYLSDETAKVLNQVVRIAGQVSSVSKQVKAQSDTVIEIAGEENRQVERSAFELNAASEVMLDIAKLALSCNEAAAKAIQNTDKAQITVLSTVNGITSIRDTIRETEKRIKRLGERSQEIGSVITIINGIAERTHILALNASMHAASAGEAGKGFAVVANEVQKLAENAREATMQISNLVNNIQVETADTVTTMNEAITQVVEGTTLAQQAGNEMRETRETTAELVQLVQRIADNSREQAETTQNLRERSMLIQKSSAETFQQLKDQGVQTERLVEFSSNLVQSVGVFTLPEMEPAKAA